MALLNVTLSILRLGCPKAILTFKRSFNSAAFYPESRSE
jgi:hypothetical protein